MNHVTPERVLLSQQEAAQALGVSKRTIQRMIKAKELRCERLGGKNAWPKIPIAEIERLSGRSQ